MDITKIDPNFKLQTCAGRENVAFYDVRQSPFAIYGLYRSRTETCFKRMPDDVAKSVSDGVASLYTNTAGGRVRFQTDSPFLAIKAQMPDVCRWFSHMSLLGSSGFDVYEYQDGVYTFINSLRPPVDMTDGFEGFIELGAQKLRDITIHFPSYNNVTNLFVGLDKDARLQEGERYRPLAPIVYYGSSITQGGCASRPGNSYQNFILRKNHIDYINLGFSGNCKAEQEMARYIAGMDMSVFVCDYDHNAPNADHLRKTHAPFFHTFRQAQPDTPVIFVSRPDFKGSAEDIARRNIVMATFQNAKEHGDKNVYYIDGEKLFEGEERGCCTVDGCHPNDIGFYRMAAVIGAKIEEALA